MHCILQFENSPSPFVWKRNYKKKRIVGWTVISAEICEPVRTRGEARFPARIVVIVSDLVHCFPSIVNRRISISPIFTNIPGRVSTLAKKKSKKEQKTNASCNYTVPECSFLFSPLRCCIRQYEENRSFDRKMKITTNSPTRRIIHDFFISFFRFSFAEFCRSTVEPKWHDGTVSEIAIGQRALHRALPHSSE